MGTIGWAGLSALSTKIIAQSASLQEVLSYTRISIGVCASLAALVVLARAQLDRPLPISVSEDQAAMIRSLADQMAFAESRARLLALAKRVEESESAGNPHGLGVSPSPPPSAT